MCLKADRQLIAMQALIDHYPIDADLVMALSTGPDEGSLVTGSAKVRSEGGITLDANTVVLSPQPAVVPRLAYVGHMLNGDHRPATIRLMRCNLDSIDFHSLLTVLIIPANIRNIVISTKYSEDSIATGVDSLTCSSALLVQPLLIQPTFQALHSR